MQEKFCDSKFDELRSKVPGLETVMVWTKFVEK